MVTPDWLIKTYAMILLKECKHCKSEDIVGEINKLEFHIRILIMING